jgi:methionyl-tRNA formyltransferase
MRAEKRPKIAIAGAVTSTARTLQGLLRNQANVVGVLGLHPAKSQEVSGYVHLSELASAAGVAYADFTDINGEDVKARLVQWAPDMLFIVGLSQLVRPQIIEIPRNGCVGFHPTRLPRGRGRAPLAWLTYDGEGGAATFFLIDERVDAGPIFVQEPFAVGKDDYAADVVAKIEQAIDLALDRWIPRINEGDVSCWPQDERNATYNGRRAPEDGLIDWSQSADRIYALLRASASPHPGAFTFLGLRKLIIWRGRVERQAPYRGVIGRILYEQNGSWLVQTGEGLLWIDQYEIEGGNEGKPGMRVGIKLGGKPMDEIRNLQSRLALYEERLAAIERRLPV